MGALDATQRTDWAQDTIMEWLVGLTLTGTPKVSHVYEPGRAADAAPWVRVSFDELPAVHMGRFNATQTAFKLAMLVNAEVLWPHQGAEAPGSISVYDALRVANELRAEMMFKRLDFQDYTVPASPVTVTDCTITIHKVDVRRIPDTDGYRRQLVRGVADWVARFEDYNA